MGIEWEKISIILTMLVLILFVIYILDKKIKIKINQELQRKTFHILMGIILSMLPLMFNVKISVMVLGILCICAMELFKIPILKKTIGNPLYGVERKSGGEIYFAVAMVLLFYIAETHIQYMIPMFILTFSDGLSAIIGKKYGKKKLGIRTEKTVLGSVVFFSSSFLISLIMLYNLGIDAVGISFVIAIVTTIIESISTKGTDNILVPISAYLTILCFTGTEYMLLNKIGIIYISILAPIFAGITNMIFCRSKILKSLQKPIDGGKNIFGDNKTYKGFLGYIIFNIIYQVIFGMIIPVNILYVYMENNIINNIIIGFSFGFAYAICELPNSYIKRKVGIEPGKRTTGIKKYIFFIFDQIDSIIGLTIVVTIVSKLNAILIFEYIVLGALIHIIINVILYQLKLRKNIA